jgi:hypothetical protein
VWGKAEGREAVSTAIKVKIDAAIVSEALAILSDSGVVLETQVKVKTATLCRHYRPSARLGDAALYWLSEPIVTTWWDDAGEGFDYVVLSTREGMTDVFPADNDGSVLAWRDIGEVPAEHCATHESTLAALGYEVTDWGGTR